MTKEQIDQMVNAFLCWKIPQTFNPDCHISFAPKPEHAKATQRNTGGHQFDDNPAA